MMHHYLVINCWWMNVSLKAQLVGIKSQHLLLLHGAACTKRVLLYLVIGHIKLSLKTKMLTTTAIRHVQFPSRLLLYR